MRFLRIEIFQIEIFELSFLKLRFLQIEMHSTFANSLINIKSEFQMVYSWRLWK